jgi:DNA-binding transcriptional LysR family regulator
VLIVPNEHSLANRDAIALREVLDEPFVGLDHGSALQAHLAGHAAREGRSFKLRVRLSSVEAICRMVESGVGIAIVPEAAVRKYQARMAILPVPLTDSWSLRDLKICSRNFLELPAHAQQLVHCLTESPPPCPRVPQGQDGL